MDAQLLVVQKLEEKEGVLQSTLAALEKELAVRTQALELNKRKVRRAINHKDVLYRESTLEDPVYVDLKQASVIPPQGLFFT